MPHTQTPILQSNRIPPSSSTSPTYFLLSYSQCALSEAITHRLTWILFFQCIYSTLRLTYPPELARLTALVRLRRHTVPATASQSTASDGAAVAGADPVPVVVVEVVRVEVDGDSGDAFAAQSLFQLLKLQLATPADQVTEAMRMASLLPSRRFAA